VDIQRMAPFGVEVEGLTSAAIDSRPDEIRALLREHALVVFRDSTLDTDDHIRLIALVGEVIDEGRSGAMHSHIRHVPDFRLAPAIQAAMSGELAFHSDLTYTRVPPEVLSLQALELPTSGGATRFANGALALRNLPAALRAAVDGRVARHVHSFADDYDGPRGEEYFRGRHFAADQPVVRRNPRTGRDVLFVTEYATQQVVGLDPQASAELLGRLFTHLYAAEHVYRHDWRPGDLLMWENQELQHSRADFDPLQRRILRRVIAGDGEANRRHSVEVALQLGQRSEGDAVLV
jgi:taurine dioxygenase